ncbi:hypothetical protein PHYSODRAFT_489619 [Phytophthora sojae]|uniref:Uncharacterized protein n=1 Tax=Phytophthora sojae (strain P6497) TaxID=1094619 RepID=G4Z6E3_PHYSP|nr:hypothetical protein PHYSODRAFT_489619 [Phytophthora sojae]EGZ22391.1 hypothetical protein PHYSODRAFT_489619 [Phytophthora sojae]|eukprot:XP_009525108.1 hypothetical protein PHYSODRAFT_489619 [Phytophthora sojae]
MNRQVEDFIPQLVAFSVDFFGSLFISVCMSSSRSFSLTALFIGMDVFHLLKKFRGISSDEHIILEIIHDERRGAQNFKSVQLVTMIVDVVRNPSAHQVGSLDGVRLWASPPHLVSTSQYKQLQKVETSGVFGPTNEATNSRTVFSDSPYYHWSFQRSSVVPVPVIPSSLRDSKAPSFRQASESIHLVRHGLQLLFHFEYLVLVEYVECVVPFVYLAYKSVLEHLPNVAYYPGCAGKWGLTAVTNLLVYAVLEVGSLLLLSNFLQRKFSCSPLYQLAFVLETQFYAVQSTLFSVTLFVLQYQLVR